MKAALLAVPLGLGACAAPRLNANISVPGDGVRVTPSVPGRINSPAVEVTS